MCAFCNPVANILYDVKGYVFADLCGLSHGVHQRFRDVILDVLWHRIIFRFDSFCSSVSCVFILQCT